MNYQHQWGQTEENNRTRRAPRRKVVASPFATCPVCKCGDFADAIAAGKCTGCKRAARKSN